MFADFLDEAAAILDNPLLQEAASRFRLSAQAWSELGRALLPDSVPVWAEARGLMLENCRNFLEQGGATLEKGRTNCKRLIEIRRLMETDFPLSEQEVVSLREDLADHALKISAIEEPAVAAMREALQA